MKKYILTLLIISVYSITHAQVTATNENQTPDAQRLVEVTGSADIEVIPDEIYISITLRERYDGKEKVTLEKQDDSLKKKLTSIGIDLKNLSLSDASSDYVRVHWHKKDALNSKDYQLKVATAEEVSKVFQALGDLKINDASISKVDHSKIEELKKDLRIKAMKDAKDKATYMLASINEQPGKVISVSETKNYTWNFGDDEAGGRRMHSNAAEADYVQPVAAPGTEAYPETSFQKIKLEYTVQVAFEIK